MERTKPTRFKTNVASKPESSFGSAAEVWVKTSFAYNAKTMILQVFSNLNNSVIPWFYELKMKTLRGEYWS